MEKPTEKESSKRSWPWKKKSSDKISAAPELGTSPNSSRLFDDQQRWDYHQQEVAIHPPLQPSPTKEQARISHDRHDRNRAAADEARSQLQQSEERARALSEKLSSALADITTKDNLVKQHVKVAEEAVTGWEKAEAEAVALKAQLDVELQQKLATEDRVAHLDGALKECMKQLRHVREEQEQRIHDTLLKKTREYDKLRAEMESKLAEASHLLAQVRSELLESRAESTALSHALQERSRSIADMSEAKGRAETDIKILQVRLETVEKENSQLKYEVHVLNKELEIRSEEREYERKAVDMASKQHLESVKKIAKLEEECNRLRLLVRKKLPGPAAIQRMRMEVDGIGKDPTEKRRRSLGRSVSNLDQSGANDAMQENAHENGGGRTREAQMLAERIVAMDEEMKMLKEALAQRNGELQSARLMCAKTATRLSVVEDELNKAKQQKGAPTPANGMTPEGVASMNGGSETYMLGLDPLKKGKAKTNNSASDNNNNRRDSQNFELMDDFAEMERLAMTEALTTESETASQEVNSAAAPHARPTPKQQVQDLEAALAARDRDLEAKTRELRAVKATRRDLEAKLAAAELQLAALQSRNSANEASLIDLQDQLDLLNEAQQEREKSAGRAPPKDILGRGKKSGEVAASEASSSEAKVAEEQASVSDAESKASTVHSELAAAVRKIIRIAEAFARATGSDFTPSSGAEGGPGDVATGEIALQLEWKNLALDNTMRNLVLVSNKFLHGTYDVVDLMTELGTALDSILALKPFESNGHDAAADGEEARAELERVRARFMGVESELERLRTEKAEIEAHLEEANDHIEDLKAQLHEGERFVADSQLMRHQQGNDSPDVDGRKEDEMIEEELMVLSSSNPALRAASGELTKLHDKVAALEMELHGERQRHQNVAAQLEDLQLQVQRGGHAVSSEISGVSQGDLSSHSTSEEDEDTKCEKLSISDARKHEWEEREIAAAALAECQRTILALGKQLKGMGVAPPPAREAADPALNSSTDSGASIQKMTENMEFLRWQAEAVSVHNHAPSGLIRERGGGSPWASPGGPRRAHRSPSPGARRGGAHGNGGPYPTSDPSFYARAGENWHGSTGENGHGHGGHEPEFVPRPPSPARSDFSGLGPASVLGSPSRSPAAAVIWSLKTRANGGKEMMNGEGQTDENLGEKPRNSSSFSRFYTRSQSGSSGSSG